MFAHGDKRKLNENNFSCTEVVWHVAEKCCTTSITINKLSIKSVLKLKLEIEISNLITYVHTKLNTEYVWFLNYIVFNFNKEISH